MEGAGVVVPPLISLKGVYVARPPNQKRRLEVSEELDDGEEEEEVCLDDELLCAGVVAGEGAGAGVEGLWSVEPVCPVGFVPGVALDWAQSATGAISSQAASCARTKHEQETLCGIELNYFLLSCL